MVLIIDDHLETRQLILEVLATANIPAQAVGPFEAIESLEDLVPEVVILDLSMPYIDGYEVLRYIRSNPKLENAFVLIVTAMTGMDDLKQGFERGADDVVHKPFAIEELLARVKRGLKPINGNSFQTYPSA